MARLIPAPPGSSSPNDFEQLVVETLIKRLPDSYQLLPNFVIKPASNPHAFELDIVVLAPHALYVVECKNWIGKITGDDTEWRINDRIAKPWPMNLTDQKCKVLKTYLGPTARNIEVAAVLVIPNGSAVLVGGGWASRLHTLDALVRFLQDAKAIGATGGSITGFHGAFIKTIQGAWGKRVRDPRHQIGGWNLLDLLDAEPGLESWSARRAIVEDPTPYRVRIWTVPQACNAEERKQRIEVIKRPTVAVQGIGWHPNLLRVQDFGEIVDEGRFYEVTEWSEYGTLHGYLRDHAHSPLTVRERLEIAQGVASALVAVHARGIVHRNLCPETVLVGFDRKPRLTDFDRAWMDRSGIGTVFAQVPHRNRAYVPPELSDVSDYDFGPESDCYALGVLLYELFIGQPPFPNPRAAADAKGEPPGLPSAVKAGVPGEVDELILELLNVDDFHARPPATEVSRRLSEILGSTSAGGDARPEPLGPPPVSFEPGSIVAGQYRVEDEIGRGSFSVVYKVHHLAQGQTYAMKVVKNPEDADSALHEWKTGDKLPRHPNVAAILWLDELPAPDGRPFVLSEYIDGDPLTPYCNGSQRLPLTEVKRIALGLLGALEAIHPNTDRIREMESRTLGSVEQVELARLQRTGIFHRDIKPANILLDRRTNEPRLIDFNIASEAALAHGRAGTPRYWAPDRGQQQPGEDLFSLGLVLYELVTGRHAFPNDNPMGGEPYRPEDIVPEACLSTEFAAFLWKAVQPKNINRFQTAAAMKAALLAIPTLTKPVTKTVVPSTADSLDLQADEADRADYNPYVTRLLTLYSQARRSNAGTRGLDRIAELTYVRTRLDGDLAPAIVEGQFRLVIVTGNAGDGKTAFLQKLEHEFSRRNAQVVPLPSGNGASINHEGLTYQSNYDGSQDEGENVNDAVLAQFLEPFKGRSMAGLGGKEGRIIAINEGRLRDFLDHSSVRSDFSGLRSAVNDFFIEGKEPPPRLLLLNLNHRSVVAGGAASLMERQLLGLLRPEIWAACDGCGHKDRCPLLANARTLADPSSGMAVRERIRRLFEVVHLRRHQHVTMRDLRSALSWLLLQDHGCEDVAAILSQPDATIDLVRLSYTQAFARDGATSGDRLVTLLREVDVGDVETPNLDRRLNTNPITAVPWLVFERRSPYVDGLFTALVSRTPEPHESDDLLPVLLQRRQLLRTLRRRTWLERRDTGWRGTLPYHSMDLLERVLAPASTEDGAEARDELKRRIVEAISLLEGVRDPRMRQTCICLRSSRVKGAKAWSFRLFEATRFELAVEERTVSGRFLEVQPDAVILRACDPGLAGPKGQVASLRLSLDLVEMLEMVRLGFRPNPNDMGGLFVNLVIFRNALLHLPYSSVLVTLDNEEFFEISATADPGSPPGLRLRRLDEDVARGAAASDRGES